MDFPKRTKQQKSEAHSYAVLLYKLRNLGIFRNLTSNDYGIDFELELVRKGQVTARTTKIQVKSAELLKLRADETPSIGGVKQTTLNYWCELSYRTNVIAYAVDLATEKIYVSRNLFWQATKGIDGGDSSKSIEFLAAGGRADETAMVATIFFALAPSAADHVYAHTLALRKLGDFLRLFADAYHYDAGTEVEDLDFRDLLEACRILLWGESDSLWKDHNDKKYWSNYEYWVRKSELDGWDGLSCLAAQPILTSLIPALVKALRRYRDWVLDGKYYWAHRNPQFLQLVFATDLPRADDRATLTQWSCRGDHKNVHDYEVSQFLKMARVPQPKKSKKPEKPKEPKEVKKAKKAKKNVAEEG
jgi:hypothetical protein